MVCCSRIRTVLFFCIASLLVHPSVDAGMVTYVLDPGSSQLTISASIQLPGPATWPVVVRSPGDALTTSLSGNLLADSALSALGAGGSMVQLNALQGTIVDGSNTVRGTMTISNSNSNRMSLALSSSTQLAFLSGLVEYSVPTLGIAGSFPLTGTVINAGTPTFGTLSGQPSVSFPVSFSGSLPTTLPGVFLSLGISGNMQGAITAVPEPTTLGLAGLSLICAGRYAKRRWFHKRSAL